MRDNFLPFLSKCINVLDDDGVPLGDNFRMSEFLRYRVRDSNKRNRISPTLSIPGMLPNYVVDAISAFQHHGTCPSKLLILHIGHMSEQERYFYPTRQMEESESGSHELKAFQLFCKLQYSLITYDANITIHLHL